MNITPKDILEKDFGKKFHGYDPEQVDEFLDEIIKQFESLIEENQNILAKNEALKSEVSRLKAQTDKSDRIEDKLMSTVITAQRNATLYLEKAEAQAQKVLDMANQNARTVVESVHMRMEAAKQELNKYERVISDYKKRFRLFLEEQSAFVDAHLINAEQLQIASKDASRSISQLEQQMRDLDEQSHRENVHLSDMVQQTREEQTFDFEQSTANLQEIVNEIIDD
ncbi:MAG: DivIVA domain-containing protein [Clostridia bacterium]|nr:DivIVA domain-containing protein [Clostridia bacterium]